MKSAFQSSILTGKLRSFCGLKLIVSQSRQTTRDLGVRTSGGCLSLKTNGVLIHKVQQESLNLFLFCVLDFLALRMNSLSAPTNARPMQDLSAGTSRIRSDLSSKQTSHRIFAQTFVLSTSQALDSKSSGTIWLFVPVSSHGSATKPGGFDAVTSRVGGLIFQ